MHKVSIVIPIYKAEKYLRECLESIRIQTHKNWECILVDDGSPDRSGEICDEYAKNDHRYIVIHKQNGGVSSARNTGMDVMRGEWLMFVDADDAISPYTLVKTLSTAYQNSLDIVQFSFNKNKKFEQHSSIFTPPLFLNEYIKEHKFQICAGGTLLKTRIIEDNNIRFDTTLRLAEDQLVMMECMKYAKKLQRIPDCLYFYRDNNSSATYNSKTQDMMTSASKLVAFRDINTIFADIINHILLYFSVCIIINNDITYKSFSIFFNNLQINKCPHTSLSEKTLYFLSKISLKLAISVVRLRFKLIIR